jgi:hypothetical protein
LAQLVDTLRYKPVPEPSAFDVELIIEKLKSRKSPGNKQIPAELLKAREQNPSLRDP